MAGLIEPNQVGVREDLSDLIAVADMKDTPLVSMMPKGSKPGNMRMDWQMDAELDLDTSGVLDGEDVTSFGNAAENRALGSVYAQKLWDSRKVGDLAQNVSDVAGVSEKEKARAIVMSLRKVKRSLEAKIGSDDDTTAQSGATAYTLRGLGSWIQNGAQTTLPVPSAFRTPTASIDSTASTAAATEAAINTVLESIYGETGQVKDFDGVLGKAMKSRISDLQLYDANASAGTAYIAARHVNKDQTSNVIHKKIDIIVGDFGTIKLHVSNFLGYASGSRTAAVGDGRFYILDMKDLELRFARTPGVKELPDLGGGPRFVVDTIAGLVMGNPLKHGAFKPTAA
jgi:hypothetical protein